MGAKALEEAQKPETNVYFGGYVLRKGAAKDNQRGKIEDVVAALMLVVDQDPDNGREGHLPLDPNVLIKTSETASCDGSRAVNRQAFYFF